MTEYVLKSVVALSATYLLYFVFARKNMNFKWLRAYFLTAILVSCTFPALKYLPVLHRPNLVSVPSTYIPHWMEEPSYDVVVTSKISSPAASIQTNKSKLLLTDVLTYAYIAGVLFLFLRFIFGLSQLVWLTGRNKVMKIDNDHIVFVNNLSTPFSFFHLIFMDRSDVNDEQKTCMLYHERVHVRQWHSVDLLLLEFIIMVQWFNPFAWRIRRVLKEIHEYLADEGTVKGNVSPLDYQHLLFVQACGLKTYLPVNGFKNSLTKKRILMITNNQRNRKWVAVVMLLVAAIIMVDSFTRIGILRASTKENEPMISRALNIINPSGRENKAPIIAVRVPEKDGPINLDTTNKTIQNCVVKYDTVASPLKTDSTHKTVIAKSKAGSYGYDIAFSSPVLFNGATCIEESQTAYKRFVKENVKYPAELKDKNTAGIVMVAFDIDETGKVQNPRCNNDEWRKYNKDAEEKYKNDQNRLERYRSKLNLLTDNPYLVAEAIRVMSLQPDYIPAKNKDGKAMKSTEIREIFFISPDAAKSNNAYGDYLKNNLKYPKDALERKAEGNVFLKYDLAKDGKYGNIKVGNDDMRRYYEKKGLTGKAKELTDDPSLVKEAIRLLKERPGYYIEKMDTALRVSYGTCNIYFSLPKEIK